MKALSHFLFSVIVILAMTSCSLTNSVHFNKDYSGSYVLAIDASEALEFVKEMDPTAADSIAWGEGEEMEDVSEFSESLQGVDGISNAMVDFSQEGVINFSFDFEDVDALNAGLGAMNQRFLEEQDESRDAEEMEEFPIDPGDLPILEYEQTYEQTGKKALSYKASNPMGGLNGMEVEGMDMGASMDEMMGFFDYYIEFSFDRKIKSWEHSGISVISEESKKVRTRVDFKALQDGTNLGFDFKLK